MKNIVLNLLAVGILGFMSGCKKSSDTPPGPNPSEHTVYVAGYGKKGAKDVAMLWKNGEVQELSDGTQHARAFSVTVSGSDVYLAGEEYDPSVGFVARLWKNATVQALTNGSEPARATSVTVSGNDVYMTGYETGGSKHVAVLWKNGTVQPLSDGVYSAEAYSVTVSGGDVYVAGQRGLPKPPGDDPYVTRWVATLWKNGTAQSLSDGSNNAYAQSVTISGNDVHVAGYESINGKYVARLWKNGTAQALTDGSQNAYAYSVAVSGNDVYVAGDESHDGKRVATLWKNGTAQLVGSVNGSNSSAGFVTVSDGVVYMAMMDESSVPTSKVWKNDGSGALTDGLHNFTNIYGIFVTQ